VVAPVRRGSAVVGATAVLVVAVGAIWLLAVPLEAACPASSGTPCSAEDREAAGLTWTAVLAGTYVAAVVLVATAGRRHRWVAAVAVWSLVVMAVVAYGAVQGSTGVVLR
jgi:hypothetical protein